MVKSSMHKNSVRILDLFQVYLDANLTKVKSNTSRQCFKNLELTPFRFVKVPPTIITSLKEVGLEFRDLVTFSS